MSSILDRCAEIEAELSQANAEKQKGNYEMKKNSDQDNADNHPESKSYRRLHLPGYPVLYHTTPQREIPVLNH